jgi:hypothetical protein
MKSIRTLDVLASPIKRKNGTTLELPVGQNFYALSQQYGEGICYRAKILKSRLARGDHAYFLHFYGYTRCDDEWIDELDIIPVHKIELGERVYACWMGDDEMQGYWL